MGETVSQKESNELKDDFNFHEQKKWRNWGNKASWPDQEMTVDAKDIPMFTRTKVISKRIEQRIIKKLGNDCKTELSPEWWSNWWGRPRSDKYIKNKQLLVADVGNEKEVEGLKDNG